MNEVKLSSAQCVVVLVFNFYGEYLSHVRPTVNSKRSGWWGLSLLACLLMSSEIAVKGRVCCVCWQSLMHPCAAKKTRVLQVCCQTTSITNLSMRFKPFVIKRSGSAQSVPHLSRRVRETSRPKHLSVGDVHISRSNLEWVAFFSEYCVW